MLVSLINWREGSATYLLRGDHDSLSVRRHRRFDPAGLSQKAGIERLDSMCVDIVPAQFARQQRSHRRLNLGIDAGGRDLEADAVASPYRIDRYLAAARDRLTGDDEHIQQQFDQVFRQ